MVIDLYMFYLLVWWIFLVCVELIIWFGCDIMVNWNGKEIRWINWVLICFFVDKFVSGFMMFGFFYFGRCN